MILEFLDSLKIVNRAGNLVQYIFYILSLLYAASVVGAAPNCLALFYHIFSMWLLKQSFILFFLENFPS